MPLAVERVDRYRWKRRHTENVRPFCIAGNSLCLHIPFLTVWLKTQAAWAQWIALLGSIVMAPRDLMLALVDRSLSGA